MPPQSHARSNEGREAPPRSSMQKRPNLLKDVARLHPALALRREALDRLLDKDRAFLVAAQHQPEPHLARGISHVSSGTSHELRIRPTYELRIRPTKT